MAAAAQVASDDDFGNATCNELLKSISMQPDGDKENCSPVVFQPNVHLPEARHSAHNLSQSTRNGWLSLAEIWQEERLIATVNDAADLVRGWREEQELRKTVHLGLTSPDLESGPCIIALTTTSLGR